ncbi:hypothetical protein niasHT_012832 [Heterodera trifolii]|uniref:Uncharacterized protein n=1 Tax=Heterodera trifolii TaxID=157864 RepID=A0ABD2KWR0_9BILA
MMEENSGVENENKDQLMKKELIGIYHEERTELERNTQRDQGDAALTEYDQKFVNSLRLNVQESRDFGYIFVVLADQQNLSGLQQKSD